MLRHARAHRPTLITTVPESPDEELDRRRRRYAIMAGIFTGCFAAGALLHRYTIVALLLCAIAIVVLLLAVITANIRSRPRRGNAVRYLAHGQRQLPSADADHDSAS
jgi:hypothetical protein